MLVFFLLSSQQYGFRKKRSTKIVAELFLDEIVGILQVPCSSISARHLTLLPTHQFWTSSQHMEFLEMKKRRLLITSFTEKWESTIKEHYLQLSRYTGVPQDSILGSLLFLLHFNELLWQLKSYKMIMYADDTVLYYGHKDMKQIKKVYLKTSVRCESGCRKMN